MASFPSPSPDSRRLAGPELQDALRDTRAHTVRHLQLWQDCGLPGLILPEHGEFNPPEWEAGHIAWFQEFWIARNPARREGCAADPWVARSPACLPGADALYDSGAVAHARRWSLPLPERDRLADYLATTLEGSLRLLGTADQGDDGLYFHRLALFHEDMHNEAAVYMANHAAQRCDVALSAFAPVQMQAFEVAGGEGAIRDIRSASSPEHRDRLAVPAGFVRLGYDGQGFAFDNELATRSVAVGDFDIDRTLVCAADFLAFVEAGGYQNERLWSAAGWQARSAGTQTLPRFHRWRGGALERCGFGHWRAVGAAEPMLHVSCHEAEAWCRWAGRALPSEAQWMRAVAQCPTLEWGSAWEWTSEAFLPFEGFMAHPYRDYSQPWFAGHRLLKGASSATHPRLRDPRYRNFYLPGRNDIFCGFRSCSRVA